MDFHTTLKPDQSPGIKIRADVYHSIKERILQILEDHDQIALTRLFQVLHDSFVSSCDANTGFYIYCVKLDMEARGMIKSEHIKVKRSRQTVVRLARRRRTRFINFQPAI